MSIGFTSGLRDCHGEGPASINGMSSLFFLSTITLAVYQLIDKPLLTSADQSIVANNTGLRVVPTLQLAVVVTRHGHRAPVLTYPGSWYECNDTFVWPYGEAELTHAGRIQLYKLGVRFRSFYNGFLSPYYRSHDFRAFSTLKERCLMSAELFLAGLFPPTGYQVWNKDLLWQPVPIFPNFMDHSRVVKTEEEKECPRFQEAKKESLKRFEQKYQSNITDFLHYVIPYTGYETQDKDITAEYLYGLDAIYAMFESFSRSEAEGFPLPEWSLKIYPEPLTFLFSEYFKTISGGSDTQIKYLEGELFQFIMKAMRSKINKCLKPSRVMYYFSGHDFTIMGLLNILGLEGIVGSIINTGSALVFELHSDPAKDDSRFFVQVLYVDGASPNLEPKYLNIPGCESPCEFHQLANITEKYYKIKNWLKECRLGEIHKNKTL